MTGDETELLLPPPTEVGKEEVQGAFRDGTCYPREQVQSQTTLSESESGPHPLNEPRMPQEPIQLGDLSGYTRRVRFVSMRIRVCRKNDKMNCLLDPRNSATWSWKMVRFLLPMK